MCLPERKTFYERACQFIEKGKYIIISKENEAIK